MAGVPGYNPSFPPPARESSRGRTSSLVLLLVVLLIALLLPRLVQEVMYRATLGKELAEIEVARQSIVSFKDTTEAFRLVAQSIGPSVVHIDTEQETRNLSAARDEMSFLYPRRRLSGQGSGVIVDKEGYVLTNYHVVAQATSLVVRLSDGRAITATDIVGVDPATDLAVIKIDADNLSAAPWGDSEAMEVGDWVLAIGNPFGLDRSVTFGIISAKGRRGLVDGSLYQDFLQTDAAVNPGNSGGPLVNLSGQVIGINTAILGQSYQGISFAIPSHIVKSVYEQLRKSGSVVRGFLGVAPQDITPEIAQALGFEQDGGALVAGIVDNSPAQRAGILVRDVIVTWDGNPVQDATDLTLKVAGTKPNTKVPVKIFRDGKEIMLDVTVDPRPTNLTNLKSGD